MMVPIKNESVISDSEITTHWYITTYWLYFIIEFLIGITISGLVYILGIIQSLLPKPPRDLNENVVLIAGASSTLGESLAEEFAGNGCSVICVDNDLRSVKKITDGLRSRRRVEGIGPEYSKHESENGGSKIIAYECDLLDPNAIREFAKKVKDEVGGIDVLVTCVGQTDSNIFDIASTVLMSHYWTMLTFLPSLLQSDNAYIVGVMPVAFVDDIYLNSRAAIASLIGYLFQELSNNSGRLTYLNISRTTEHHNSIRQTEQQVAWEIVQEIRGSNCAFDSSWCSKILYRISYMVYNAITTVSQWVNQDCDYSF